MDIEKKIKELKNRWTRFLDLRSNQRFMFIVNYLDGLSERPLPYPENKQKRIDWAWEKYKYYLERMEWLDDDQIPHLDIYTGTEIFAGEFGCKVHRPERDMPCAIPMIKTADEAKKIKTPDLGSTRLVLIFEIADELKKRAGKDAILKLNDIQSPMDIAALIWDKSYFFIAMKDTPEIVRSLSEKVEKLLVDFLDEFFKRYGKEFIAHCPDYYMPGGVTLSEDEIGNVNNEMFTDLFLPELLELSNRYGAIGIHCCANARHQWQNLSKIPQLKVLNLSRPTLELDDAYKFFENKTCQMHEWYSLEDPDKVVRALPENAHVVLQFQPKNKEHAIEICKKMRKYSTTSS